MEWTVWIGEPAAPSGVFCFSPLESADDGGIAVVCGMNYLTTVAGLSARPGVQRIYTASSIYDLSDAQLVFDRAAEAQAEGGGQ